MLGFDLAKPVGLSHAFGPYPNLWSLPLNPLKKITTATLIYNRLLFDKPKGWLLYMRFWVVLKQSCNIDPIPAMPTLQTAPKPP